jgi:hypothetical protein
MGKPLGTASRQATRLASLGSPSGMRWLLLITACTAHNLSFNADLGGACDPATLSSDPHHCGTCSNDCALLPHVDGNRVTCVAGNCAVANACVRGFGDCSSAPGCETDFGDTNHCGGCNTVCSGATPLCAPVGGSFVCTDRCPPNASTRCGNRCVDTSNDPQHCGSCDPCPVPQHGQPTCSFGVCDIFCDAGFHACGDLCLSNASPQSCGSLCTPCQPPAHASPTCNGGICDFVCDANFMRSGATCVPVGGCTSCPSGHVCADGLCCVGPAGICSVNADCCSGNCDPLFFQCNCAPAGNNCTKDGDCCLLKCASGKCACNPVGGNCVAAGDCCSGNCDANSGTCVCGTTSSTCKLNSDCCGGVCGATGQCVCKSSGSCSLDSDCCSKRCDNNTCNLCTPNGGSCSSPASCCSGQCSAAGPGGTCQCISRGGACSRDSDCCSNACNNGFCRCAVPTSQVVTDACVNAEDCCWGSCSGGTCFCKAENDSCILSSECCEGLQCSGSHCVACLTGGNCTTNVGQTQCCTLRSYFCPGVSALCCGQFGAVCFTNSECCNGMCGHDNRCSS